MWWILVEPWTCDTIKAALELLSFCFICLLWEVHHPSVFMCLHQRRLHLNLNVLFYYYYYYLKPQVNKQKLQSIKNGVKKMTFLCLNDHSESAIVTKLDDLTRTSVDSLGCLSVKTPYSCHEGGWLTPAASLSGPLTLVHFSTKSPMVHRRVCQPHVHALKRGSVPTFEVFGVTKPECEHLPLTHLHFQACWRVSSADVPGCACQLGGCRCGTSRWSRMGCHPQLLGDGWVFHPRGCLSAICGRSFCRCLCSSAHWHLLNAEQLEKHTCALGLSSSWQPGDNKTHVHLWHLSTLNCICSTAPEDVTCPLRWRYGRMQFI